MPRTRVVVSHTTLSADTEAGACLASDVLKKLDGRVPDVLIVFASPACTYTALLEALYQGCAPRLMMGCS